MSLPKNPYEPPTANNEQPAKPGGSLAICIVSIVTTIAYIAFTVFLLRTGTPAVRKVGMACLGNALLLICLSVAAFRSTRRGTFYGIAATIFQSLIMAAIPALVRGAAVNIILLISVCTIIPMLFITAWSWSSSVKNA